MRKLIGIVVAILIIVLVVSFVKDTLIKTSVEKGTEIVTGLRLNIKSLQVGVIKTLVSIKDLRLFNPPGFKDKIMLDMPEIYVDYNLPDIIKGKIHLNDLRINMKEFIVVKNEKGELNLDSLKVVKEEKEPARPTEKKKGAPMPEIQIDVFELKVGKVIYKDYSKGGKPSVQEFDLNLNERFTNITDPNKLVAVIVVKALMNTSIAKLTNFDLGGLQGMAGDTLKSATKITSQLTSQATETAGKAAEGVTKAAEDLTKSIKLPFGAKKE